MKVTTSITGLEIDNIMLYVLAISYDQRFHTPKFIRAILVMVNFMNRNITFHLFFPIALINNNR